VSARSRQHDIKASILASLAQRPGSTAGDLAKGLSLERDDVATRLTQLVQTGDIKKTSRGYRMS
jgi:predicted ArsR family transcriptional regulator